jgi:glycosyltransferase involved in cell wall biosynthesis
MSSGGSTVPAVSVVIPTYRRPALLRRCLQALLQQGEAARPYEVIVVDDGHDEATGAAVDAVQADLPDGVQLRYTRPAAGRGPAVARNTGWRLARAPLVAFTDDDTVPAPGWLAAGCAAMARHPAWSAASGRVRVPRASDGPPTDHERMTQGLETAEFVTANVFVRHAALVRVDGFDERFERAWREDSDLQFRLAQQAGPVGRVPEAEVLHPVRPERWGVSLRQQRNTFFDALLYKKHPRLYRSRIRPVPPWDYYAIVAAVAGAAALLPAGHPQAAAACLGLATTLVARLAWRRLAPTSRQPAHVLEMIVTSALIPFLSVYWRLRGAWRFRVLFL